MMEAEDGVRLETEECWSVPVTEGIGGRGGGGGYRRWRRDEVEVRDTMEPVEEDEEDSSGSRRDDDRWVERAEGATEDRWVEEEGCIPEWGEVAGGEKVARSGGSMPRRVRATEEWAHEEEL